MVPRISLRGRLADFASRSPPRGVELGVDGVEVVGHGVGDAVAVDRLGFAVGPVDRVASPSSTSWGPISTRRGTPWSSCSSYLLRDCGVRGRRVRPGRRPRPVRRRGRRRSRGPRPGVLLPDGDDDDLLGRERGGRTRPWSSECVMMSAPSERHDSPHEVVWAVFSSSSASA